MTIERALKRARKRALFGRSDTTLDVTLGQADIHKMLPHRAPMLLVDRIATVDLEAETIRAISHIDPADPVLAGHFPGDPVYPGCLILEAMGQASLCLHHLMDMGRAEVFDDDEPRPVRLVGIRQARFFDAARPGDDVHLLCTRHDHDVFMMTCLSQAMCGDRILAVAAMDVFMVDPEDG